MNRRDPECSLWIGFILLVLLAAWYGFPWQAFAQPFPVLP